MHLSEPAWYCVRSHPKHEHIAAATLRQIVGVEVFNPRLRFLRFTRRGRVWVSESLFPNYLFARFVLTTFLEKVRFTPSVAAVVSFGNQIPGIPDHVIEDLRKSLEGSGQRVFTDAPNEGDEVEITTGPFQGAQVIVTRVLPAKQRVQVLLEVMGRSTAMELDLKSIIFEHPNPTNFVLGQAIQPGYLRKPICPVTANN